ncbi:MAG: hypothetical protein MRQ09_06790 [Candidatus Midichloria sp.]|nr:hypothetical protein [Candidatus Midichloria sp.]
MSSLFTHLQELYEIVANSAEGLQFAGFPRRYPDFDPDDNSGYSNGGSSDNNQTSVQDACLLINITAIYE